MEKGRKFTEVFPEFTIPDNLQYLLSKVIVTKIVMYKGKRELVIHLRSPHLMSKRQVNKIAYDLKKELFGNHRILLKIDDTYELSSQYTLAQLLPEYWESILYDVKNIGKVEYILLSRSQYGVDGNIITLLMEDSIMARQKSEKIKTYLVEMFAHRFHMDVEVGFNFTEESKKASLGIEA